MKTMAGLIRRASENNAWMIFSDSLEYMEKSFAVETLKKGTPHSFARDLA